MEPFEEQDWEDRGGEVVVVVVVWVGEVQEEWLAELELLSGCDLLFSLFRSIGFVSFFSFWDGFEFGRSCGMVRLVLLEGGTTTPCRRFSPRARCWRVNQS